MIFAHNDYRIFLRAVFSERVQRNPAYSLRAFAKQISISPSQLSEVLSNRNQLSSQSALKVGQRLGLASDEVEYFGLLVQKATAKDPGVREATIERMSLINQNRPTQDLSLDAFRMIADWYHIPILEMSELPRLQFTPKRIAKRLGITAIEAETAIERLLRLELLEKQTDGSYKKTYMSGVFRSEHANLGLRHFHKKMLEKATDAIETQSNQEKMIGSETFLFDKAALEKFKQITEEYFTRVVNLSKANRKKPEVYHLGIQMFKVTSEDQK